MNVRNLLTGCGAGCLLTLVVAAVVGALVFREVKDSFDRFESVADLQARLLEEHGSVADYVPPADGVLLIGAATGAPCSSKISTLPPSSWARCRISPSSVIVSARGRCRRSP